MPYINQEKEWNVTKEDVKKRLRERIFKDMCVVGLGVCVFRGWGARADRFVYYKLRK